MKYQFVPRMVLEIANEIGITVDMEEEYGVVGELIFKNGKRQIFMNSIFNVNSYASARLSKDKSYTKIFLKKHGFNVPEGRQFFSNSLNEKLEYNKRRGIKEALVYASELGYPVFVKPNSLGQGKLVMKAYGEGDIIDTANLIFDLDDIFIIEKPCEGRDHRVLVYKDKVVAAYQRLPLSIVGDGVNTVDSLLNKFLSEVGKKGVILGIKHDDHRIDKKLTSMNKNRNTVIANGENLNLLDNTNLATGGTSIDYTEQIHPDFKEIAIQATKALGLKLSGIDLMANDITLPKKDNNWSIIESNSVPGLDHYASLGTEQYDRVKNMYAEILIQLSES